MSDEDEEMPKEGRSEKERVVSSEVELLKEFKLLRR
jgi:hypothetical protein